MPVDRDKTKSMHWLQNSLLKFRKNMCKKLHFVRSKEVSVHGPRNGRVWE